MIRENKFLRFVKSSGQVVPIINLHGLKLEGAEKKSLAETFGRVCSEIGFFYVENHGVSEEFLDNVKSQMHAFFDLPFDVKNEIHISKSIYHRGYVPSREENALGSELKDIKEVFDMALELPMDDPDVIAKKFFHGPNAFPESLPEFKVAMLGLYDEWRGICEYTSSLMALALGLKEDYFSDKFTKPMSQLRAAKYPSQKIINEVSEIGCGAHTDYSLHSVIWQMDEPGLQIQNLNGDWIDAPVVPGAFVCPLGDSTAMWTNNYWKATIHRVINLTEKMRHSSAFFYDPNFEIDMSPIEKFVDENNPPQFEPITMGEHIEKNFNGTFEYRATETEELV